MSTPKRERQKINREAKLAAQRAEARARRNRRFVVGLALAAVAILVVWLIASLLGGGDEAPTDTIAGDGAVTGSTAPAATSYDGYLAQPVACGAQAPAPLTEMTFEAPVDQEVSGELTATIQTSCGPVEIALDADAYPETVNSFVFLAREGYFDGTACHRIVSGFMVQCGDPTATGSGGPGYRLPDEVPQDGFVYERGVVAMANAGSGTTGSQFFIVTGDASHLGPQFSILGTVVGGDDTLDLIEQIPVGPNAQGTEVSNPSESLYIESVTIE